MKLSELIAQVGEQNILVQRMDNAITGARLLREGGVELKVVTGQVSVAEVALGDFKMHGLILWIPRDLLATALPNKKVP